MVQVGKMRPAPQQGILFSGKTYIRAEQGIRAKNQRALMAASDSRFPFVGKTTPHFFSGVLTAAHVRSIAQRIIANHWGFKGTAEIVDLGTSKVNNQPVMAIQVIPEGVTKGNLVTIFCAGNHNPEYAGPHANLHLLDLILGELKNPKSMVAQVLGDKALVFVPLANPDGAIFEQDGTFAALDYMGPRVDAEGLCKDHVVYQPYYEASLRPETAMLKTYLESVIDQYGAPFLTIDFHESPHITTESSEANRRKNRYVFAPLEVTEALEQKEKERVVGIKSTCTILRPVIDSAIDIFGTEVSDLMMFGRPRRGFQREMQEFLSFSDWAKIQGARSFIIETPQSLNGFHVGDRVLMDMLAVQAIFQGLVS